jgi:hypothetical protein
MTWIKRTRGLSIPCPRYQSWSMTCTSRNTSRNTSCQLTPSRPLHRVSHPSIHPILSSPRSLFPPISHHHPPCPASSDHPSTGIHLPIHRRGRIVMRMSRWVGRPTVRQRACEQCYPGVERRIRVFVSVASITASCEHIEQSLPLPV